MPKSRNVPGSSALLDKIQDVAQRLGNKLTATLLGRKSLPGKITSKTTQERLERQAQNLEEKSKLIETLESVKNKFSDKQAAELLGLQNYQQFTALKTKIRQGKINDPDIIERFQQALDDADEAVYVKDGITIYTLENLYNADHPNGYPYSKPFRTQDEAIEWFLDNDNLKEYFVIVRVPGPPGRAPAWRVFDTRPPR